MGRSEAEIVKAIDIAIEVFRREGYERTGIEDLVTATNLNRYAIYQQFGGKRELFLAALHRDSEIMIEELKNRVENRSTSIMATVKEYMNGPLEDIVDSCKSEIAGSLVCQAAFELAPHDRTIAENVHELMNRKIAEMERIFKMAKEDNSLRQGISPRRCRPPFNDHHVWSKCARPKRRKPRIIGNVFKFNICNSFFLIRRPQRISSNFYKSPLEI